MAALTVFFAFALVVQVVVGMDGGTCTQLKEARSLLSKVLDAECSATKRAKSNAYVANSRAHRVKVYIKEDDEDIPENVEEEAEDDVEESEVQEGGNKCKKYELVQKEMKWTAAMDFCRKKDMQLLSIESLDEQSCVVNFTSEIDFGFKSLTGIWTSGQRSSGNDFRWASTGQPFGYANWSPQRPDNYGGMENCVNFWNNRLAEVRHLVLKYKWNDEECTKEHFVICEPKL